MYTSFYNRLLDRANIIQKRLDEENAQLAKRQGLFQRSRDHVEGAVRHDMMRVVVSYLHVTYLLTGSLRLASTDQIIY